MKGNVVQILKITYGFDFFFGDDSNSCVACNFDLLSYAIRITGMIYVSREVSSKCTVNIKIIIYLEEVIIPVLSYVLATVRFIAVD